MTLDNWEYCKRDGYSPERGIVDENKGRPLNGERVFGQTQKDLSSLYTRGEGIRSPKMYFVISEGEKRERDYLKAIKDNGSKNLKVIFLSPQERGGCIQKKMYDKVNEFLENRTIDCSDLLYDIADIDHIYLISDVDEHISELRRYVPEAKGYQWIVSNPSFEIWLYYSYFNNPTLDFAEMASDVRQQTGAAMKRRNDQLKRGGIDPRKAFGQMRVAIKNSLEHYDEDEFGVPTLFSTQMHRLAQDILNVLGSEYNDWLTNRRKMEEEFKKGLR